MGSMGNGYDQYGGSGGNDDYAGGSFGQNEPDPYGSGAGDTYNDHSAINGAPPGSGAVTRQPCFPHPQGCRDHVSNLTSHVGGSGMSGGSSANQMGDMGGMNEMGGEQPMSGMNEMGGEQPIGGMNEMGGMDGMMPGGNY
jgi:hypothetical protein